MKSFKEFLQWNFWFAITMILFTETAIYALPVASHFFADGETVFSEYYSFGEMGWMVCGFVTLVWWMCLGQKFESHKSL
jgi:hypothetical protein